LNRIYTSGQGSSPRRAPKRHLRHRLRFVDRDSIVGGVHYDLEIALMNISIVGGIKLGAIVNRHGAGPSARLAKGAQGMTIPSPMRVGGRGLHIDTVIRTVSL
jgi:hypothetical protein